MHPKPFGDLVNGFTVPKLSGGDIAYGLTKGGVSSVPIAGGALAEMMQVFFASPIEKRREDWMRRVATALNYLLANGLSSESLQSDERFISAVFQANLIAQRTHQKEKLEALRNALINIALRQSPDEVLESIFLSYVDTFTEWHVRILRLFQSPAVPDGASELHQVLEAGFPQMKGRSQVYNAVWRDLSQRELVNLTTMARKPQDSGVALGAKRTTDLGDQFLTFISEPKILSAYQLHEK